MPVIEQSWIKRADLRANPDVLYVFGDNLQRKGMGGQAGEMRGEPNAVGVATKYAPTMSASAFFGEDDAMLRAQMRIIDQDFKRLFDHVKRGGVVIWPLDGIGTGLSELPQRAPSTDAYIRQKLAALKKMALLHAYKEGQADERRVAE